MTIKEIIRFLRSIKVKGYFEREERQKLRKQLSDMGIQQVGMGAYSYVYRIGNFVIKVSSQSFEKLRTSRRVELFRKYAPPIYYIHESGYILVCKYVEYKALSYYNPTLRRAATKLRKRMRDFGFQPCDLHEHNLVKCGSRWQVIDYGCWFGNH